MPDDLMKIRQVSSARARTLAWVGFAALTVISGMPTTTLAGTCSIEAHGRPAYARVTKKVREKLSKMEQFDFEAYDEIQISMQPNCVLKLHGRFSFKKQRNQEARVYDAEVTPKSGAPGGIKILKLRISAP